MGTVLGEPRSAGDIQIRSVNGRPVIDQTFEFLVRADTVDELDLSVLQSPGLPIVNSSVSASGYGICTSKRARRDPDVARLWNVEADFSTDVEESQGNPDPTSSPVAWVPVRETKSESIQEVVATDQSGDAVANSAGQPFSNGLTITRKIPVWEFYQFEPASVTDETVLGRSEVVNSGTYAGKAAKTFLCTVLSSVIGFYYGQPLRFTRYSLKYNYKTWQHRRLDVGTVYLSGGNHLPYEDNSGNVILGALNGTGGKQTAGTAPAILSFDQFATSDFSFLRV